MSERLSCYRCGHSLDTLPLPLGRRDLCPACGTELHVCRMCRMYAPREPGQCAEEDALDVTNKEGANFCDYFKPTPDAFHGEFAADRTKAQAKLATLFGDGTSTAASASASAGDGNTGLRGDPLARAEELFKR